MGRHRDKHFDLLNFGIYFVLLGACLTQINGASINRIEPSSGSLGGETRITIYGSGFSSDQFSQSDDPNVGNRVYLVGSGGDEVSCPTHLDGSTPTQVMCYTPRGMTDQDYYVKMVVDGVTIPDSNLCGGNPTSNNCKHRPTSSNTPTVTSFTPNSGVPGDFVRFEGKMFSDRYGSNIDVSSNGKYERLLRVYVGPQDCGLKNGDDPWGLSLDSSDSDNGHIVCQTKGSSVGFFNASFIVEAPYGRSLPDSTEYLVSYKDDIYLYQVYTNITSISPSSGSTAGGLTLTVNGNYFDNRSPYAAPKAYIEDTECTVTNVVLDQYLECKVAADPSYSKTYYRGNRGATFEWWTSTTRSNLDDILTLTSSDSGYNVKVIDETYYFDNVTDYVSRMTFFFEPPHSGQYQFQLYGNDDAKLFVDGTEVVSSSSNWRNSARMTLSNNTLYRLQVVHKQGSGNSKIHLKAKYFDTKFTSAWTGKAEQEVQTIGISSDIVYDVQELTFSNFGSQSETNEVQTVVVNVPADGSFRLGLYGVFTEPIAYNAEAEIVATAFKKLPVFTSDESVTITRSETSTPTFSITFVSKRGDFPDVEVRGVLNGATVTGSVTENTKGVSDLDTIALQLEGRASKPIKVSELTANTLKGAIEGMFEAQCPTHFESSSSNKIYYDFETSSPSKGKFGGTRTKESEPFCGRYTLKNSWYLYETGDEEVSPALQQYGMVCFAYKGILRDYIWLRYTYQDDITKETSTSTRSYSHTFQKDSDTTSTSWYYTCHNMYTSVQSTTSGATNLRIQKVWVQKATAEDIYIDAFYIGATDLSTGENEFHLRRQPPAMPNNFIIKEFTVTGSGSSYVVTLKPYDCGNTFGLFELANGQRSSGNSGSSSNAVAFDVASGRMSVSRTDRASPPVTGFIDITFNGNSKNNLNVSLTGAEFQRTLETLQGIGSLSVAKNGDCANFDMPVTFVTLPGDLPMMSVQYNQLSGINAAGSISGNTDGGLYYDPLTGDMLSTVHSTPQVRVFINDVPTACASDCSFAWSSTATPTVSAVSPASGTSALNTRITITGTGFSSTDSDNQVTISNVACTVVSSSSTSISCDVGNGPVGSHKVMVNVKDMGDATHTGSDHMFNYTAAISSISPASGSLGGGHVLTLTGYGFKSGASVTINSQACDVINVQPATLTCNVPASSSAGAYDVVVSQGSVTLTHSSYTYDASVTATVNTVVPSTISVSGDTVTISGSTFGSTEHAVMIGTQQVTVQSWSDSQIVIETGLLSAGNQELRIETGNGYAVDGSSVRPLVNVELSVTNIYPLKGSIQGGTILTITGSGFGTNTSSVSVVVGNFNCGVTTVTNTEIKCLIENAGRVHQVTNGGTDPAFGIFYAFDRPYVTINKGDFVQWSWTTPDFVNDVVHAIIEVDSPSATTPKTGGFSSGTPLKNGQFTYQFTEVGTYYVWSGYNDIWNIKNYAGTVNVVDAVASVGTITVQVAGKEAIYNVGGASDPTDSSSCQAITSAKTGCTETAPTGQVSNKFNFEFLSCSTPIITSIDQRNGTTKTTITITGEGFSTENCQNEVTIANTPCTTVSSTATQITCQLAKSGEPQLGVLHPVSLRVANRGTALISIMALENRSFAIIPNIDAITPESGSLAGGAVLTISGYGLKDSPFVSVNGQQCNILSSSFTEIQCETPSVTSQQTVDITATVNISGSPYPVSCETRTQTCKYAYLTLRTPTVTDITPSSTNGSLSFTVTGTGLGTSTSEVQVIIGGEMATVSTVSDTSITGMIANLPVGTNDVYVKVKDYGKASGSLTVTSTPAVVSVTPSSGSTHGETTVTIAGSGFVNGSTTVTIGGSVCNIQTVTLAEIVCVTSARAAASVNVQVTSMSQSFPTVSYNYDTGSTPTITAISPQRGLPGTPLTITGTNLNGDTVSVMLDGSPCTINSNTGVQIVCTLGNHATGSVPVKIHVSDYGASNTNVNFEYELDLISISPSTGGIAGGQTVTLSGSGFDSSASVTICSNPCTRVNFNTTKYMCKTPANTAQPCDVSITVNGLTRTLTGQYTYDASVTPTVSGVTPTRGGTKGGTAITISGSGFGTTLADVSVTINGAACVSSSVTNTQIECVTGEHTGSINSKVDVEIAGNGIAQESTSGASNFQYVDVWSSNFTWGGGPLPDAGDFVVIPAGQTLILDTNTPVLKFLLIQGGQLIFDDKDVELQSEIIMITDGGLLQVGTEAQPFQHKGIITLHGHHRSKELPIYGTKVLAVRNGTLDLHGIEIPIMWTRLASTATAGSNTLVLKDPVEWNVGDEIVIAATGHRHTQSENEKKTISAISADKMTLTLSSNLAAGHLGTEETFDGTLVEFRGEVGLLTHNVVVRGNTDPQWEDEIKACEAGFDTAFPNRNVKTMFDGTLVEFRGEVGLLTHNVVVRGNTDPQWEDEIKACEAGFDTGEFATQTCFLGRFGDEIGSSQFGGMILVHAPERDTQLALARLSYIEVTFAGQAFRLGRYPIHFHLNGEMSNSYVRGVSIHHAFNRAVNIHGSFNTIVEKTVIYNIMGGAFFLEDGIETGNTFQYNLAVFVRESSSLLNDDVTPASFWVTNPNNTIRHNAAAGGTHFGYWYRMHDHPDGPSFTSSVCPKLIPLGEFHNNTAHSFGWFGLWIFPDFFPKVGACGGSEVEPAVFSNMFSWNNEKGIESVNGGALQFVNCTLVQNQKAGYEGKKVIGSPRFTDKSAMVKDSLIIGTTTAIANSQQGCTNTGITFAYGYGFRVVNTRFVNFAENCAAMGWTSIDGTCTTLCGGFTYHTQGLSFINAPKRVKYRWDWEGIIVDRDGTLADKSEADWKVVPKTGTLPPDCEDATFTSISQQVSVCPPNRIFHRYSFNNPAPASLEGKDFVYINQWGNGTAPFRKKAITHKMGWMLALVSGEEYKFEFKSAEHMTNMSWTGKYYEFESDDYIMVKLRAKELPDRISIDGGNTFINATVGNLDPNVARYGDWTWDSAENEITFMVHGSARSKRSVRESSRSKRAVTFSDLDPNFAFTSFKCFYQDCIPPPDPDTVPPQDRPLDFHMWHWNDIWNDTNDGYITNDPDRNSTNGPPTALSNVKILYGSWVIINTTNIPQLGNLLLEGVLEVMDTTGHNYELNVDFIIIRGGRLVVGTPETPFMAAMSIIVRGNHSSPNWNDGEDGPTVGAKAIAVFGGLDLHGKDKGITWTKLGATADTGSSQITLLDAVNWEVGDDIVLGPTGYDVWETESFRITTISGDKRTLTLNDTLQYKHLAHAESINGRTIQLGAAVGLLTHNIKIIGEDYSRMYKEYCGARVLVGLVIHRGQTYTGYARLSNVEFYHTGQEAYTEEYDPRFSLAYVATGTVTNVKPSSVTKCSFHNGFNSAVGAFGIGSLNITDNVVFGSIGHAIRTSSDDTRIVNNMVALVVWTGAYQGRAETFNFFQDAGIEAVDAKGALVVQDNLVTGGERFGFHLPPQQCSDTSDNYKNNIAQSNTVGVGILPNDAQPAGSCLKYQNFITWKNLDYGIYYQGGASFVGENNVVIEERNGYHCHVTGPAPLSHQTSNKTIEIKNGLIIGSTATFDCTERAPGDSTALNLRTSASKVASNGGKIGVTFGNFMGASNNAPIKPWSNIMTYPAISGLTKLKNMTFAHFNPSSCNNGDFAIATSKGNDDGQHPVEAEQTTFVDVAESQKISYHRPNTGKINSADCVDMDCDGLKKSLFKDLDGTFLGSVGAVIPQSEFEWGTNPVRGLGDYRIPKEMVTEMDGTRIPYDTIAPNKGIIRSPNCTYMSAWTAYKCYDYNYEMLIIESMDADTETRRLSPVAILGQGYIDLINGPQDHGWCSGYTCRKRISTFMAIVATGFDYLMHFTSTTPERLRYHLLNVDQDQGIKLTVWYSRPNRLDVYVDDTFMIANNARIENGNYIISKPVGNEYTPVLANASGTNYVDRDRGEISIIIKGPSVVEVVTMETIIVSFGLPALTVDQFYGANLVENIAAFFDIPLTKVRVVNVVSAQNNGRRRRSTGGIEVTVEIADPPASSPNTTSGDSLSHDQLVKLGSDIVNECQAGNVSSNLNISGGCNTVSVPPQDASQSGVTYNTPSVSQLLFHQEPSAHYEGKPLRIQPAVQAVDISNVVVTQLGTIESPWQLSVAIRPGTGHANAMLHGTKTVNASNGWFNFTDLAITHMGTGYVLDFSVIYPQVATNFTLESSSFDVAGRPIKVNLKTIASGIKARGVPFAAALSLKDRETNEDISDITWRSHTWTATAKVVGNPRYGGLQGTMSANFDVLNGEAEFTGLNITGVGVYYIQFNVVSTPADYNLTMNMKVVTRRPEHINMNIEKRNEVKLKFDVDYYSLLPSTDDENALEQYFMEEFANRWANVVIESSSIAPGSIVVTFVIAGNTSDVNSTAYSLCDSVLNGTSYAYNGYTLTLSPFMTVDNQSYYGVTCGAIDTEDSDDTLSTGAIIGIAIGGTALILLVIIIIILVWKFKVVPNTKTHGTSHGTNYESNLFREDSFVPMKGAKSLPPAGTTMMKGPERRPESGMSSISVHMKTPEPGNPNAMTNNQWQGYMFNRPGPVNLPPSYLESEAAFYVDPHDKKGNKQLLRSSSPAPSTSSSISKMTGRVTPFDDRASPMAPVGHDLYNTDYVMTPVPRSTTPHVPAPTPKLGQRKM